ncbi:tRNA (adenosine(37)-N6)-threonylcarbamoyltransferase complex dimerization subunit type 1 TsaB [Paenibacillus physcomitrellae]|uniref:Gcp-like domain-containing protein n=1 Tax=Paenibacillus physcomitrellae TaxID=1619311 RepID=A0ABQ1FR87_9BACL|nr:tRNA (adenosine(37)-N6)-threonylcarbamoyltransferase complex dimerization subunit type 1 TsaB [Paenibacillus physcomitrellae]GGA27569.1 hypothetical protein GCM10010917_10600 [Paenibacillus physcomitrellae]
MEQRNDTARRYLVMDTSTATLCTAVMDGARVLAENNLLAQRGHAELLMPAVQKVLEDSRTSQRELAGIITGVGPGSYTGIRIAVTAGKSLAWALGIPVVGISSLEMLALGAWAQGAGLTAGDFIPAVEGRSGAEAAAKGTAAGSGDAARTADGTAAGSGAAANAAAAGQASAAAEWVVPLMDARRGQVYTALFEAAPGGLTRRLEPDGIRLMADWTGSLAALWSALPPEARPSVMTLAGDTDKHAAVAELLRPLLGDALRIAEYAPEGAWGGLLGAARLLSGERDEAHELQPNYTQLTEAEVNKLQGL